MMDLSLFPEHSKIYEVASIAIDITALEIPLTF